MLHVTCNNVTCYTYLVTMLHITCNNITCYMGREVVGGGAAHCSVLTAVLAHSLARSPGSLTHSLVPTDWYSPLKEQGTKNLPYARYLQGLSVGQLE